MIIKCDSVTQFGDFFCVIFETIRKFDTITLIFIGGDRPNDVHSNYSLLQNFYTKITFWGSLGNKPMRKFGPKNIFGGLWGPLKKNFRNLRVSTEFLNSKSLEPHVRPRHLVWVLE